MLVAFGKADPAYFLSGLLNSTPIALFVRSYAVQTSISGHIFEYVALPQYDSTDPLHKKIADLARLCHKGEDVLEREGELDENVAKALKVSSRSLKTMRDELNILRGEPATAE